MNREKPILCVFASHLGVYEVAIRLPADDYDEGERLSAAIKPALSIIDGAVRAVRLSPKRGRQ